MGTGPFREIGGFLDECDRGRRTVTSVEFADAETAADGRPSATVELTVPPSSTDAAGRDVSLCAPRLGPDGSIRFALDSTDAIVPATDFDIDVELLDAAVDETGQVTTCLQVTPTNGASSTRGAPPRSADAPGATDAGGTAPASQTANGERNVPPFKDPDLLADVYESCDTFAQMAEAIDMDVTDETVRRYMIDYDIHQPNSYRTGDDGDSPDAESTSPSEEVGDPVVLSDGIGLPDEVTVETLIDTVKRSNTIYEVTREVNVGREDALEMLEDLNLLDLVVGRLATEGERDISREEIVGRMREASGTQ